MTQVMEAPTTKPTLLALDDATEAIKAQREADKAKARPVRDELFRKAVAGELGDDAKTIKKLSEVLVVLDESTEAFEHAVQREVRRIRLEEMAATYDERAAAQREIKLTMTARLKEKQTFDAAFVTAMSGLEQQHQSAMSRTREAAEARDTLRREYANDSAVGRFGKVEERLENATAKRIASVASLQGAETVLSVARQRLKEQVRIAGADSRWTQSYVVGVAEAESLLAKRRSEFEVADAEWRAAQAEFDEWKHPSASR